MSSSIAVTYKVQTTVVETLGTNVPAASVKEVTHTLLHHEDPQRRLDAARHASRGLREGPFGRGRDD